MTEKNDENMEKVYRGRRRWLGVVIVCVAVLGVVALTFIPSPEEEILSAAPVEINVEVMEINPHRTEVELCLPGTVDPNRIVQVSAEVAGRVERISCTEGRTCREGRVMIELNSDLLSARHAEATAMCDIARYELQSVMKLHKRGVATDFTLNQTRSRLTAAQALLKAAKVNLGNSKITAPISGILNDLLVEKGEYVKAGTPVAEIVDIERVKVVIDVPERHVEYLKVGDVGEIFRKQGQDGKTIHGRIGYISELADRSSKTTRVEIVVDNAKRVLRSGKIVHVCLALREVDNAILIPLSAVITMEKSKAVYVIDKDGLAQRQLVKLGFLKGRCVQILGKGLQAGDRLVIKGHHYLAPGQKVKIIGTINSKKQKTNNKQIPKDKKTEESNR